MPWTPGDVKILFSKIKCIGLGNEGMTSGIGLVPWYEKEIPHPSVHQRIQARSWQHSKQRKVNVCLLFVDQLVYCAVL